MTSRSLDGPNDNPDAALLACWRAGVAACDPRRGVMEGLDGLDPAGSPWVIAVGKASVPMADAALSWLSARGRAPAGGVVVPHAAEPVPGLEVVQGDHPLPGEGSRAAAEALASLAARLPPGEPAWVLLSGGTTSLVGAPEAGLTSLDLRAAYEALLGSGWDIGAMNRVRKRLTRWGGGKLRRVLGTRPVLQLIVSDVLDDDLAAIGSGPLVAEPSDTADVVRQLHETGIGARLPAAALALLERVGRGEAPDVVSPAEAEGLPVTTRIVVSNRVAVEAAAAAGRARGWQVTVRRDPLLGEAADRGRELAAWLLEPGAPPALLVAGGETTVQLPEHSAGLGGRCQELALAAAARLRGAAGRHLLAAGTDGRDGPTDAAGALVDGATWDRAAAAGVDPASALDRHDSHPALDAAGALLRTGPTGTNVADLVLALRGAEPAPDSSAGPAAR